jgi:hypothetical protein
MPRARSNGPAKTEKLDIPPLSTEEMENLIRQAKGVTAEQAGAIQKVAITPPNMRIVTARIRGLVPYVQHAFSEKARAQMEQTQRAGQQARSRKTREARDFEAQYMAAQHRSVEGWCGIPAPAFRNACIDACRLCGFKMTHAKCTIFIEADGYDHLDMSPLVKITKGEPRVHKGWGRNANGGADLRWRPLWDAGWEALVTLKWDADQLSPADIFNLLSRAGLQVGVGEGRPFSPNSNGIGWGTFEVLPEAVIITDAGKKTRN